MSAVRLGEVARFTSGGTPSRSNSEFYDGAIPWITGADIAGDGLIRARSFITEEAVRRSATQVLPEGTVALVTRTSVGKVGVFDQPTAFSQDITAISPTSDLDTSYLVHFLRSKAMELASAARGATIRGVTRDDVAGLELPLPSVGEQRRIAVILDAVEAVRARRRKVHALFVSLEHAIYRSMFGPAHDYPQVALGDIIKWSSGRFLPAKAQTGGPFPVYGGNGINGSHEEFLFEEPRIVVGRVGAYCGAVHVTQPRSWVTDNALVATVRDPGLTLEYLRHALTVANLNQYAAVSGQPSISASRIAAVSIARPPEAEQQEFGNRLARASAGRANVERALVLDDELFASLQARAFSGRL